MRSRRRRKTIEITVDPVQGVRVAAPARAALAEIEEIVARRAEWIRGRLQEHAAIFPADGRLFESGELFDYLGREVSLRVTRDRRPQGTRVRLAQGRLEVTLAPTGNGAAREAVEAALERWYRARAARAIRSRVAHYAAATGDRPKDVVIRSQERRWGSCSSDGTLRFNWRIIMAPLPVVDYVVVHELCHLHHPHHQRAFWDAVAAVMPDYQAARAQLRREGARYRL